MATTDDIRWFKTQFHDAIASAVAGTPFDLDLLTALACQETGEIWPVLRKNPALTTDRVVALCVGDTLDADRGRRAFPKTKSELIAAPNGQAMFDIARKALVDMAAHVSSYRGAAARPNKFVHGFGVWQYDLQFFKQDPEYFLERRYERLGETLGKAMGELQDALRKLGFQDKSSLTDFEMACVAIAYNTGGFVPRKGLKQGFFNGARFYGEEVFDFVRLSRTVASPGSAAPAIAPAPAGNAIVPPPTPVDATGAMFVVDTRESPLRLRSEPKLSTPPGKNVIAHLPDGHRVHAVTERTIGGFMEVETSLFGAHLRGFASTKFLKAASVATSVPVVAPITTRPATGIVALTMPRRPGTLTKRTAPANAHSLNEPGQPGRKGTTPSELVAELVDIVNWLGVDRPTHKRYQPHSGLTFCNIYAHDYCHLAGAYLPRVWWTQRAVMELSQGSSVEPLIGSTILEVRANDLFRWLRDFGPTFGWRQTGTLDKLQQAANQGGLGLIVARRKEDGRSGHIVMVVPETNDQSARRSSTGEVVAPVQSQAGTANFRFGTGTAGWWNGEQFAESAFWIHS